MAPCLLATGNLVEAAFEKQRAFKAGDNKYEQLRGVGNESKRLSIEQGTAVGTKDYFGQIQAAENRRKELMQAFHTEADSIVNQGALQSSLIINQASITKNMVGPLRPISLIYLELARIKAEDQFGLLLRINDGNPDPPLGKYPNPKIEFLGRSVASATRHSELAVEREKLQKKLPALVTILRTNPARMARERTQGVTCSFFEGPHTHDAGRPR